MAYRLEAADRLSELLAVACVLHSQLDRSFGGAEDLRRGGHATQVLAARACLVQVEVGPIGLVLQTGGVLGTLAFKAAGLAVVYAFLSYARPMGQFIGLTAVVVVGLIGTAGNLWALAQVTRLI